MILKFYKNGAIFKPLRKKHLFHQFLSPFPYDFTCFGPSLTPVCGLDASKKRKGIAILVQHQEKVKRSNVSGISQKYILNPSPYWSKFRD
jgi:hypothetical protein